MSTAKPLRSTNLIIDSVNTVNKALRKLHEPILVGAATINNWASGNVTRKQALKKFYEEARPIFHKHDKVVDTICPEYDSAMSNIEVAVNDPLAFSDY